MLWNQVYALQKHFKKDNVHMRLWTRFYSMTIGVWHEHDSSIAGGDNLSAFLKRESSKVTLK